MLLAETEQRAAKESHGVGNGPGTIGPGGGRGYGCFNDYEMIKGAGLDCQ